MSGFLLDTSVISVLSPARSEASASFLEWLERVDGEGRVFLSVVAIHEIEKGIALLEHRELRDIALNSSPCSATSIKCSVTVTPNAVSP